MNLPAAIALAVIAAGVVFVVAVRLRARSTARVTVDVPGGPYAPGDVVPGRLTIEALRPCQVDLARVTLTCFSTDPRDAARPATQNWKFRRSADLQLNRTLAKGEAAGWDLALEMPAPGEVSDAILEPGPGVRYRPHWALNAEVTVNGLTLTAGETVRTRAL